MENFYLQPHLTLLSDDTFGKMKKLDVKRKCDSELAFHSPDITSRNDSKKS